MPRVKLDTRQQALRNVGDLLSAAVKRCGGVEAVHDKVGLGRGTLYSRLSQPETLTLAEVMLLRKATDVDGSLLSDQVAKYID